MHNIHQPDEQGFIPFIHNYCDRRCERCNFVRQCRVGIVEVDEIDPALTGAAEESFETYMDKMFRMMGMSADEIEEAKKDMEEREKEEEESDGEEWKRQAGITDEEDQEYERVAAERRERLDAHPFSDISMLYGDLVSNWIDPRESLLKAKGISLQKNAELLMAPAEGTPSVLILREAIDELLWFQHMLWVKGQRALSGRIEDDDDLEEEPLQSDMNGSAKLTLHIIDRCVSAWTAVMDNWPEEASTVPPIIAHLNRCKTLLSEEFPEAHKFIRPGFDGPEG